MKTTLRFIISTLFLLLIAQCLAGVHPRTSIHAKASEQNLPEPDTEFMETMQATLQALLTAASVDELRPLTDKFSAIAENYPGEWLPPYYTALAFTNMGYLSEGDIAEKDGLFDEAEKHLAKADELQPENSEVMALKSFILMGRLSADPQSRGMYMGDSVMRSLNQARQLYADNPRVRLLSVLMEHGSAQFMGQSTDQACRQALSVKPAIEADLKKAEEGSIMPAWGINLIDWLETQCL